MTTLSQYEAICNYWESLSLKEKISYCKDNGESIFASRYDAIPEALYDQLSEAIY
jgi:hypothetical protein